jgi:hypothetical protein
MQMSEQYQPEQAKHSHSPVFMQGLLPEQKYSELSRTVLVSDRNQMIPITSQ